MITRAKSFAFYPIKRRFFSSPKCETIRKFPNAFPKDSSHSVTGYIIENPVVPAICNAKGWFQHNKKDGNYADNPYPLWDWSDGISPPASYLNGGGGLGESNIRR